MSAGFTALRTKNPAYAGKGMPDSSGSGCVGTSTPVRTVRYLEEEQEISVMFRSDTAQQNHAVSDMLLLNNEPRQRLKFHLP